MPGASRPAWAALSFSLVAAAAATSAACTTVDPGKNFVIQNTVFDPNYFYCHVEPQFIFAYGCGNGGSDPSGGCHFNASAVSGMVLLNHTPVNCGGGDIPVNQSDVGTGSQAASNYGAVSLEMNTDWMIAPLYVRPSMGQDHPRVVFSPTDTTVTTILSTWASK
jgi:hypothetical protein